MDINIEEFEIETDLNGLDRDLGRLTDSLKINSNEEDASVLFEAINDANYYSFSIVDSVEILKDDLDAAMTWGNQWKEFALKLIEDNNIKEI